MTEPVPPYRRLASGWGAGAAWHSLLLGEDHLLAFSRRFGFEHYRRFFLRDIRALVVRRTKASLVRSLLCLPAGLGALYGGARLFRAYPVFRNHPFAWIGAGTLLGLAGALLLVVMLDFLLGATCAVTVHTLAGIARLGAPVRWRKARRVLGELEPRIRAAQTAVPPVI